MRVLNRALGALFRVAPDGNHIPLASVLPPLRVAFLAVNHPDGVATLGVYIHQHLGSCIETDRHKALLTFSHRRLRV